jgi:hypothetical protein
MAYLRPLASDTLHSAALGRLHNRVGTAARQGEAIALALVSCQAAAQALPVTPVHP